VATGGTLSAGGVISGAGITLTKDGGGVLNVGSGPHTYGKTSILNGTVLGTLPGNLELAGTVTSAGAYGSQGNYLTQLGTAAGQIAWTTGGGGGLSAVGGELDVALGTTALGSIATPSSLTWASTANFVSGGTLMLNSNVADNLLKFYNPLS